jgi:hypothetical protein
MAPTFGRRDRWRGRLHALVRRTARRKALEAVVREYRRQGIEDVDTDRIELLLWGADSGFARAPGGFWNVSKQPDGEWEAKKVLF